MLSFEEFASSDMLGDHVEVKNGKSHAADKTSKEAAVISQNKNRNSEINTIWWKFLFQPGLEISPQWKKDFIWNI